MPHRKFDAELDKLMEEMNTNYGERRALEKRLSKIPSNWSFLSKQMLVEVIKRADAAESKEEGDAIINNFLNDVIHKKITPYV